MFVLKTEDLPRQARDKQAQEQLANKRGVLLQGATTWRLEPMAFAHQHAYICEAEMARGNAFSNSPPGQPQPFPRECEQQVTPPVVQQQEQAAAGVLLPEPLPGTDLVTQALDQRLQDLSSGNSSIVGGGGGSALSGTIGEALETVNGGHTCYLLAWLPSAATAAGGGDAGVGGGIGESVDPVATWVARRDSARPIKLSISQLTDTERMDDDDDIMDTDCPVPAKPRRPARVEKMEVGMLLTAGYLDVSTLLQQIQEKTGIEPHEQLLLCVRQGFQKRAASDASGSGVKENLAECVGRVSALIRDGVLSDDAQLTVEQKPLGWQSDGKGVVSSLADRQKADRERVDLIRVICEDIELTASSFDDEITVPRGTSTIAYLTQAVREVLQAAGCNCQDQQQHRTGDSALTQDDQRCRLCTGDFRLRRCIPNLSMSMDGPGWTDSPSWIDGSGERNASVFSLSKLAYDAFVVNQ